LYLSIDKDSLNVKTLDKVVGKFKHVKISGIDKINIFKIKPSDPDLAQRTYTGDVSFTAKYSKIEIINHVKLDDYIAGVVETEGGPKAHIEFYRSQAIICRTYTFENIEKHTFEGFNLCDGVHCQAYKGRSTKNPQIIEATISTSGLVISDTSKKCITAAFHSNCGGRTENSGNVWLNSKPYLVSIDDTFCTNRRSAKWEKTILASEWKQYLERYGAKVPESNYSASFAFNQHSRAKEYTYNNVKILLKDIRYDWKLRSSFFSIVPQGDNLLFKGRGYGHGVGLCQEGAMQMAESGFKYKDIIKHYYTNVEILPIDSLKVFEPKIDLDLLKSE